MKAPGSKLSRRRLRGTQALVVLAVGGMVAVTACSSSGGKTTDAGSKPTASSCPTANKKLEMAFVYAATSHNPMQEMAKGAQAAADEDGNTNILLKAPTEVDAAAEVQMLNAVAKTQTDGIAWESVTPDAFLRDLKTIKENKTPLVAVDNMTPQGVKPDLLVSNSNTALGRDLGEAFAKQNPKADGEVVLIIDVPTLGLLKQRVAGLTAAIKEKLPKMKISGPFDGKTGGGAASNLAAIQGMVHSHPKAVAFIGVGSFDGINLPLIKQKSGATWLAGSADIAPAALTAVKDGSLFALSSPEHWLKGYIAVHEMIEAKRHCTALPTGWWDTGNLLIDKSNIDGVLARQKDAASQTAWFMEHAVKDQLKSPPLKSFDDLK